MNISAKVGSFGVDSSPFMLEPCRERFAKLFTESLSGFFFKVNAGDAINVATFIFKTESALKLSEFSRFSESNRDTLIWFEPCAFWKSCSMRRSLMTILLRCGLLYDVKLDNYEYALFNQDLVVPTRRALERFMFGFTKYVGPSIDSESSIQFKGWKIIFESMTLPEIKTALVSPDENTFTPKANLTSALWF